MNKKTHLRGCSIWATDRYALTVVPPSTKYNYNATTFRI